MLPVAKALHLHQGVQALFEQCQASMDPNSIAQLLAHHPYHIDALLAMFELYRQACWVWHLTFEGPADVSLPSFLSPSLLSFLSVLSMRPMKKAACCRQGMVLDQIKTCVTCITKAVFV